MNTQSRGRDEQVWAQIERDKRIDRRLRRISFTAWTFTVLMTLAFAVITGLQTARVSMQFSEVLPGEFGVIFLAATMADTVRPLVNVLGLLSTLIATLATIGIFMRMRTASLHEIQLRLAALETMLTGDDEAGR